MSSHSPSATTSALPSPHEGCHHRTPSPPTQTFHPSFLPHTSPADIVGSAAGGAHYSGARIVHRDSDIKRASFGDRSCTELNERRTLIMNDIKELYECRPTQEIFERSWRSDAVFEDPITYSKGLKEVMSQWFAMPLFFSKSVTVASRVLQSSQHPPRIIYSQTQEYTIRLIGIKRRVKSIIIVDLDEDDRIVRLCDQWNGEDPPKAWGAGFFRRFTGRTTPWFIRVPKEKHTE